jgi:predicted TIM-barrel fold metal-dependent hydrolase
MEDMVDYSKDLDWIISVDDHIIEPPGLWQDRASVADRDRVPRVTEQDGQSVWVYEDVAVRISGALAHAGRPPEEVSYKGLSYNTMPAALYSSQERVKDMDRDGVLASLCFPFFPRYAGQTFYEAKDKDLAHKCVTAYNDWILEEWSGAVPGRFLPLAILPLWDPKAAALEVERTVGLGAKAIAFSENPTKVGLPSIHSEDGYWEPVFQAVNDTGVPLAIHFGSSSEVPVTSADAPGLVSGTLSPISLAFCLTDWIWSGILPRMPRLKILMSEGGIGWIPYMIERCEHIVRDHVYRRRGAAKYDPSVVRNEGFAGTEDAKRFPMTPTELFRRHIYGCFIDDEYGCRHLEEIGLDNVLMETDYPHGDGTFPNSLENARRLIGNRPEEVQYKLMQGNARDLFGLDRQGYPLPSTT